MGSCDYCGSYDDYYDEHSEVQHENTPKHHANRILYFYNDKKKQFRSNRNGIYVACDATVDPIEGAETESFKDQVKKVYIHALPKQAVKFQFEIRNETNDQDIDIVGVQLAHPQQQFQLDDNPFVFGRDIYRLKSKTAVKNKICVKFHVSDIGQYEMPIMFTFRKVVDEKIVIIVREMCVLVEKVPTTYVPTRNPYKEEEWTKAGNFLYSTDNSTHQQEAYKIPRILKMIFPTNLEVKSRETLTDQVRRVLEDTIFLFEQGITKENYIKFFHYLLWWEETIARINLRKYNMPAEKLQLIKGLAGRTMYSLEVPGLAEKRPSLMRGDKVYIRPLPVMNGQNIKDFVFECVIKEIEDSHIRIGGIDEMFEEEFYHPEAHYRIRFLMSRVPLERMHHAVNQVFASGQGTRVFPEPNKQKVKVKRIEKFYNPLIKDNKEQRSAVEHIVAQSSGTAPYMVFGPPGTGKTMTIIEAIVQIVASNPSNRVLVCTDSNMAADHVALGLLKYQKNLNIDDFLLRANSQYRTWNVMPQELIPISNGESFESFYSVTNEKMSRYKIVVATLLHVAKFASEWNQNKCRVRISHLFIDEAAQASEPASLVPISGLLSQRGSLVLSGDPKQLGPVCISKAAEKRGLGKSLMERLLDTYPNLYGDDTEEQPGDRRYITMLIQNFRSHPDILEIPNKLEYGNKLKACAKPDPLSTVKILPGVQQGGRAIVFHGVNSMEQRIGKTPSFYNEMELQLVREYITALIKKHSVAAKDIGVIAPYIRQVYKVKSWLKDNNYEDIEVGTVEAFQGKEKRVILISTVRANCKFLDHDFKYGLGFLVDRKRFNVALTRAKAKCVIVGNPRCLERDHEKWGLYMETCLSYKSYLGLASEQLRRTAKILTEVAVTRFNTCKITEVLRDKNDQDKKVNSKKGGKNKKQKFVPFRI